MCRSGELKRRLRFVTVLLVVLGLAGGCQRGGRDEQPPAEVATPTPKGELFIQDNALGAWTVVNNTFAMPDLASRATGTIYYWAGVLLQIGDFPAAPDTRPTMFEFERIAFSKAGVEVRPPLLRGNYSNQVFWVNIVSKRDNAASPMAAEDVANLYPSAGADPCAGAVVPDIRCLRGMKIHGGMDRVIGVVTYWQGNQGFWLETVQRGTDQGNQYTFKLLDDFEVEVFEISTGAPASIGKYPVGEYLGRFRVGRFVRQVEHPRRSVDCAGDPAELEQL